MKQSKLRKRRVWRYAVIYFILFIIAVALIAGPIVAGKKVLSNSLITSIPDQLFQPYGLNNNDTRGRNQTGTGAVSSAAATATGDSSGLDGFNFKIKLY